MVFLTIFDFFFGNPLQSKLFLIVKLVVYLIICLVSIVWPALKNVNDEAVMGKRMKDRILPI